jgi:hypothetical protein
MNCEEKTRLLMEYKATTAAFSEAVKELHAKIGTSPKEEYERLERIVNKARWKSEQARLALEAHNAAHRCRWSAPPQGQRVLRRLGLRLWKGKHFRGSLDGSKPLQDF